ncbi:MAG: hypothetical protein PVH40_04955, partial [Gemmatimonadales bacterium]
MIRRILHSPITKLVFYYAGLLLVAGLIWWLIPPLRRVFELDLLQSSVGLDQLTSGTLVQQGFLSKPLIVPRTVIAAIGGVALVIPLSWVYMVTRREVRYDRSLTHTILILPMAV